MTLCITRRTRALLMFVSASGYTAWFSGIGERTEAAGDASPYPIASTLQRVVAQAPAAPAIARDPFAGAPDRRQAAAVANSPAEGTTEAAPTLVAEHAPGDLDVPNIGDTSESTPPSMLVVRATIVGKTPVAYIEDGTSMDIVRIGDSLAGQRVIAIDLRGLTFGGGTRLDLPDSLPPVPAPQPAAESLSKRIDEIRRLLVTQKKNVTGTGPAAAASTPAPIATGRTATASPSFPTPAPLATVDSRGIAVGTNPTPDASGPTPFPNPYPYAPAR